jgi:hypothetical protein
MDSASDTSNNILADLLELGAERLSDSFVLPAIAGGPSYKVAHPVRFHGTETDMWLRIADVPFNLFPDSLRPMTAAREGIFVAIGPGLTVDLQEHPAVVHVQIEGPPPAVSAWAAGVRALLRAGATAVREASTEVLENRWTRTCVAALAGTGS